MHADIHEKNLVQLYLTGDDSATLTLAKLVCGMCVYVCVCCVCCMYVCVLYVCMYVTLCVAYVYKYVYAC